MDKILKILMPWSPLISVIATIVTVVATVCIAAFTYSLKKINKRQHTLDYQQKLDLYPYKFQDSGGSIEFGYALVNSSALPLVMKEINVEFKNKKGKKKRFAVKNFKPNRVRLMYAKRTPGEFYGKEVLPEERPPGIFIRNIPWVIGSKNFAIFSYKISLISLEYKTGSVRIEFKYYNESKKRDLTISKKYIIK